MFTMRQLERCFLFVLCIAFAGTIVSVIYSSNVPKPNKSASGFYSANKGSRSSRRRINRVTRVPSKEELALAEMERDNKTRLILDSLGSKNTSDLVMPFEDTVLIRPNKSLSDGEKPFAVILVTSLAEDKERREVIRETWYSWGDQLNCRIYFFLGLPRNETLEIVLLEEDLYGDIILDNFVESYYKLPIKILRMLKWYLSEYKIDPPSFLIKTDDDVFLNLPLVIDHLKRVNHENYIGGMRHLNSSPHRDPHSKWYVPESVYPNAVFPTFAAGPCYFIDGALVEEIYTESFHVPLIHLEDVYLLGLVANQRLNLTISDVSHMVEDAKVCKAIINSRSKFKQILAFHPVPSSKDMKKLFHKIMITSSRRNLHQYSAASNSRAIDKRLNIVLNARNKLFP